MANPTNTQVTKPFRFKAFTIEQDQCTMKVGTDGVLLGAWIDVHGATNILDIGTGTGVIAIMAAQRNDSAHITAIEIEDASYQQAQQNAARSPWQERLQVVHRAIQDFAREADRTFDVIVCNPPFFSGGTLSHNHDRNAVRHTVKLPTGDLLYVCRMLLSKEGKFGVILPYIEGLRFKEQAERAGFYCTKETQVHPKADKPIERLLLQFERHAKPCVVDTLIVQHEERNDYTDAYIALTKDFYLNM